MKRIYLMMLLAGIPVSAFSQSAIDAYRVTQPDLKGTARFMSMGGAFGALGGDLSTLSQNPAGLGVYRSNELGFTINLDVQSSTSESQGYKWDANQTKFLLNNIGGVATLRLNSETMPNLNLGFTYNKAASFNRKYNGAIPTLSNSMTNYIAGIANNENLTVGDLTFIKDQYDPYNPTDGGYAAPWLAILGYDSYFINPNGDPDNPHWTGQWGNGTSGSGNFSVVESGSVDEYNIAFGGNIKNVLYWGMNFDIINIDYNINALWGEDLDNAYILNPRSGFVEQTNGSWNMRNYYRSSGSGFNYQLGFILKPIQELRFGFAFHTPTWYKLTETYSAITRMNYYGGTGSCTTNDDTPAYNDVNLRSPWKIIASVAGVIGNNFIISADYEWAGYNRMKFSQPDEVYDDYYYDPDWELPYSNDYYDDIYYETNKDIRNIYRSTNTLRIGAEFRVTPSFSVRAGYSFVSSPVKVEAKDDRQTIYTAGTMPNYRFDNTTNYITCGLGYKYRGFYIDLAYVYKHMNSEYHAYTPDPSSNIPSPQAAVKFNNSQVVMSMGFRF